MKLFILNCPYRKREKNGNNNVRNKSSNSNISTPLKAYMHTVQMGISNQVLFIKLELHLLQNPTLQYRQKIFKNACYWKATSLKLASQVESVVLVLSLPTGCQLYSHHKLHHHPELCFRTPLDIPLLDFPPNLYNTSHSPSNAVTLSQ